MSQENMPAIRDEIVATITPDEIAAALLRILKDTRKTHPGITNISPHVRVYSDGRFNTDWNGHGVNGACVVSSPTMSHLVENLANILGDPMKLAERKRAEAAQLIAEAANLEAAIRNNVSN